jgi:tRNA modification GTPase
MNDRLDLTQVEALGDTLAATTERQRKLSVRGTTNTLVKRYESWRQQLLYARGELEALIDFSEDQHFDESPAELCASVSHQVRSLKTILEVHSQNAVRGELLRNGISISLLGAPNAGKSSLLNRIVGREAAIVSQQAGTTRDIVEVGLDLGGYFCRVSDTAGLRKAKEDALQSEDASEIIGQIEKEGMRRAKERAAESDVVIVVLSFEPINGQMKLRIDPEVLATAAQLVADKNNVLVAINKTESVPTSHHHHCKAVEEVMLALPGLGKEKISLVSCKAANANVSATATASEPTTDDPGNIQSFLRSLISHFGELTEALVPKDADAAADAGPDPSIWQESLGATERHRLLLEDCIGYLDSFLVEVESSADGRDGSAEQEADIVLAAEHLRGAADCLAKITGRGDAGDVEEVLGVVFDKFCVGK